MGPLAIDGPRGRAYAPVRLGGQDVIGVFNAADGRYEDVLRWAGGVAVDAKRGRILVDEAEAGLHVLDAEDGKALDFIPIPTTTAAPTPADDWRKGWPSPWPVAPLPKAEGSTVLVARVGALWSVDLERRQPTLLRLDDHVEEDRWWFGWPDGARVLQLRELDDGSTLAMMDTGSTIGRSFLPAILPDPPGSGLRWLRGLPDYCSVASLVFFDDRSAIICSYPRGEDDWLLAQRGMTTKKQSDMRSAEMRWLPGRDLLMANRETIAGDLLVLDPDDLSPVKALPLKARGRLNGYDASTDRLYFSDQYKLRVWSYADAETAPPIGAGRSGLQRTYRGDQLLFDWNKADAPASALPSDWICAASTDFANDQTALCGADFEGLFRTDNGGRSFMTAMRHLPNWSVFDVKVSPDFARDELAFVALDPFYGVDEQGASLYRSVDAGDSWQPSGVLSAIAFAPDYQRKRRIYGFGFGGADAVAPQQAYRSDDSGRTWQALGQLPEEGAAITRLYAFEQPGAAHPVLLAIGYTELKQVMLHQRVWPNQHPVLYRSIDGGWTWNAVLAAVGGPQPWGGGGILAVKSRVARQALLLSGWEDLALSPRPDLNPGLAGPSNSPPPRTYRSYDLGATWHSVQYSHGPNPVPLAADVNGRLIGLDPDKGAHVGSASSSDPSLQTAAVEP